MIRQDIQAILPLTPAQQALLIGYLHSGRLKGSLQVECTLSGHLTREQLLETWSEVVGRHEALRSTAHWREIEKPVQVIRKEAEAPVKYLDWTQKTLHELETDFLDYKENDLRIPLDIEKSPAMRLACFRVDDHAHRLLWTCHHLFVDGWSGSIVIRDLALLLSGRQDLLDQEPASLKAHRLQLDRKDRSASSQFWSKLLETNSEQTLLGARSQAHGDQRIISANLTVTEFDRVKDFSAILAVTPANVVHGAWAIVISQFKSRNKVFFGTTVSGRSEEVANLDETAGMFTSVLPVPAEIDRDHDTGDWLRGLQNRIANIRKFDFFGEDEVARLTPGRGRLFDSLIVFENIPSFQLDNGALKISDYKSGIVSAYPATLAVRPANSLDVSLFFDPSAVTHETAEWLLDQFMAVMKRFADKPSRLADLVDSITAHAPVLIDECPTQQKTVRASAQNSLQATLVEIWKEVLGLEQIGIEDDFFEIGGRSLTAVRLFALISKRLKENLSPVTILEHPTIRQLADTLSGERSAEDSWSSVVPMNRSESGAPLFCLHAGGGHVLFYRDLVKNFSDAHPVFAVQPVGMDGVEQKLETVEEMASHYIREVRKAWPKGPYSFLGYCFSSTVGIEIARQLREQGNELGKLIVVDSPPMHVPVEVETIPTVRERLSSYVKLASGANWKEIGYRLRYKVRSLKWKIDEMKGEDELAPIDPTLADAQEVLARAYKQYKWRPFEGDLTLIMAGPLEVRPWAKVIIEQWKSLVRGETDVRYVNANHATMFEEPDVKGLAAAVQDVLSEVDGDV